MWSGIIGWVWLGLARAGPLSAWFTAAPTPARALSTVLAPGDTLFICIDCMVRFCLTGVRRNEAWRSEQGLGYGGAEYRGDTGLDPGNQGFYFKVTIRFMFWGGSSLREDQAGATEAGREMAGPRLGTHVTDIEKSGGLGKDGHRDEARV